jgi:hypothetical protein
MATVASVVAVVVIYMTGTTFRGVILIETEVFIVIERGRSPAFLRVTLPAVALDILMQVIAWIAMATIALLLYGWLQQLMRELTDGAKGLHALMIAVARNAVLRKQFLMERDILLLLVDGQALGGLQANLLHLVALDALLG